MPEPFKLPKKGMMIGLAVVLAMAYLLMDNIRLRANLGSTTKITTGLKSELEGLKSENQTIQSRANDEQVKLKDLSVQLDSLKQDKDTSVQHQEELKRLVGDAEKALENQNKKIHELEQKLQDADEKIRRQKKASANLEQQTKSAKANPGMTQEYVKLVESEWMHAINNTQDLQKDLDRTLVELSGQNKERTKLRSETATMHYNLAVILTDQRNYPAAIREYRKVLETRPDDADAHYNLAILYDDYMKDSEKALEHYRQYVKVAPDSAEAPRVRQWIKDKEFDTTFKFKA